MEKLKVLGQKVRQYFSGLGRKPKTSKPIWLMEPRELREYLDSLEKSGHERSSH